MCHSQRYSIFEKKVEIKNPTHFYSSLLAVFDKESKKTVFAIQTVSILCEKYLTMSQVVDKCIYYFIL